MLGRLTAVAATAAAILTSATPARAATRPLALEPVGSLSARTVVTDQRRYVVWQREAQVQTLDTKRLSPRSPLDLPAGCRPHALSDANLLLACSPDASFAGGQVRGRVLDVIAGTNRSVPFPDPVDGFGAFGRVWVEASVSAAKANDFFIRWRSGRVRDHDGDLVARNLDDRRLRALPADRPVLLRRDGRLLLRVGRRAKAVRLATCRPRCRSATVSRRGATWIQGDTVFAYDRDDRHRGSVAVAGVVAEPVDADLDVQHTRHAIVVTTTNAGRAGAAVRAGRWP